MCSQNWSAASISHRDGQKDIHRDGLKEKAVRMSGGKMGGRMVDVPLRRGGETTHINGGCATTVEWWQLLLTSTLVGGIRYPACKALDRKYTLYS